MRGGEDRKNANTCSQGKRSKKHSYTYFKLLDNFVWGHFFGGRPIDARVNSESR